MEISFLSLVLNVILMGLLGAVIYYAKRLSESISIFRSSREDMENLIKQLSKNVDKAEAAIKSMRRETDTSADDLHFMITKAKALSEELQFIQESGDRLANRLEQAGDGAREKAYEPPSLKATPRTKSKAEKKKSAPPKPMFSIIDREEVADDSFSYLDEDQDIPDTLKSQAERDLAMAIKRQQNSKKG